MSAVNTHFQSVGCQPVYLSPSPPTQIHTFTLGGWIIFERIFLRVKLPGSPMEIIPAFRAAGFNWLDRFGIMLSKPVISSVSYPIKIPHSICWVFHKFTISRLPNDWYKKCQRLLPANTPTTRNITATPIRKPRSYWLPSLYTSYIWALELINDITRVAEK